MADHQARGLVQGSLGRAPGQDNSSGFGNMVNQGANEQRRAAASRSLVGNSLDLKVRTQGSGPSNQGHTLTAKGG